MELIKIVMTNSEEVKWTKEEWDDYVYDGKYFIIKRNGQWVGMYNLDYVISISDRKKKFFFSVKVMIKGAA